MYDLLGAVVLVTTETGVSGGVVSVFSVPFSAAINVPKSFTVQDNSLSPDDCKKLFGRHSILDHSILATSS